ncbi:hypothetical protein BVRB_3g054820 [Beta vulgaris subsp. vulgaris]|nr:hypothetical protein BVRB_3g054820 [Beta vulgaris subsp. vulgaris]
MIGEAEKSRIRSPLEVEAAKLAQMSTVRSLWVSDVATKESYNTKLD